MRGRPQRRTAALVTLAGAGAIAIAVSALAAPGSVTNFKALSGRQAVALQWDELTGATGYEVFRRNDDATYPATATAATTTTKTSYVDPGLTVGQEYCYKVRAVDASGPGPLTEERCAAPQSSPPPSGGTVTGLTATSTNSAVLLDWDDADPATRYDVYRGSTREVTATPQYSTYTDRNLTNGTRYCYRVAAINRTAVGPASEEVCATPTGGATPTTTSVSTPGPTPFPPSPTPTPRSIDLSDVPSRIDVSRTGRFTLRFTARPAGLRGLVRVESRSGRTLAEGDFVSSSNERVTMRLRLRRFARKGLKRKGSKPAVVEARHSGLRESRRITLKR